MPSDDSHQRIRRLSRFAATLLVATGLACIAPNAVNAEDKPAAASEEPEVTFENLAIFVEDGEKAARFYIEVLGFRHVGTWPGEATEERNDLKLPVGTKYIGHGVRAPNGGLGIGFYEFDNPDVASIAFRTAGSTWVGETMVFVRTSDIAATHAKVLEYGYKVYGSLDSASDKNVRGRIFVEGPGNIRIHIYEPKKKRPEE